MRDGHADQVILWPKFKRAASIVGPVGQLVLGAPQHGAFPPHSKTVLHPSRELRNGLVKDVSYSDDLNFWAFESVSDAFHDVKMFFLAREMAHMDSDGITTVWEP